MAFIEKLVPAGGEIPMHAFSAAVFLWTTGRVDRAQLNTILGLDGKDTVELNRMLSKYNSLPNEEKREWHGILEAAGVLWDNDRINQAQFMKFVGLDGARPD